MSNDSFKACVKHKYQTSAGSNLSNMRVCLFLYHYDWNILGFGPVGWLKQAIWRHPLSVNDQLIQ